MKDGEQLSLERIRAFLAGSEEVGFKASNQKELYEWTGRTLRMQDYGGQGRTGKGLVKRYIAKVTGLSRAQLTRLVGQFVDNGVVQSRRGRGRRFTARYTPADIVLLAEVDEAHETLSGPATQKILYRQFHEFAEAGYERLAEISVAHIYNLRKRRGYRERRMVFTKTRPTPIAIGERRKPEPGGRPGYLRVDTVHQGDLDGVKGVYHINAVDEVTQWQVVGATEHISEAWLESLLKSMLRQFPFRILGFHSDNGSEFINHNVAGLLNKLLIEQTKSRPQPFQRQRTGGIKKRCCDS
jgi:DNA-binding MarR family transcriptional regulator